MRKKHDWEKLIAEQERSGQSASAFCRERGLSAKRMSVEKWRRKRPEPAFVQVRGKELTVEIVRPSGAVLRVPVEALKEVLEALGC